jgi:hypothetical protein
MLVIFNFFGMIEPISAFVIAGTAEKTIVFQ